MSSAARYAVSTWAVAALAFVARLVPVLRGGGLFGLGDYDDGVHYAAAVALVHGRLPYQDFLFLHPPGILIALVPFAALGRLVGEPTGFAAARVGWMLLGAVNALLVMRILRHQGLVSVLLGGVFYALFLPAVYGEHTTQLEGLATTCMLIALLLLRVPRSWRYVAVAGAALGASMSIKIWGAAAVVVVAAWAWRTGGLRRAGVIVAGAAVGATVICLPFFVSAPTAMARMVVRDQLGRAAVHTSLASRLTQIAGLPGHGHVVTPTLVLVLAAGAAVAGLAWLTAEARLAVALLAALTLLLAVTPSWFVHYASLIAGPAAVTVGFGAAQLIVRARNQSPRLGLAAAVVLGVGVAAYAIPLSTARFGETFPRTELGRAVANVPGCVTTDNPTALIEMDVFGRNLDRGCRVVVDLGGQSYDEPASPPVSRDENHAWQRYALDYLQTGSTVVIARFSAGQGFSSETAAVVRRWPVVHRVGRFTVRALPGTRPTVTAPAR